MRVPLPALKALGFAGAIAGGLFAGSASADPAAGFPAWSDNPFAFTLSDDLFAKTDEFPPSRSAIPGPSAPPRSASAPSCWWMCR